MLTIEHAMNFIYGTTWKGSVLGLERISQLVRHLGEPQKKLRFVHIAGTNGKGSTAAMLASALQEAGYKTGLYTSPFVHKFNELIQINGEAVSDNELISLADATAQGAAKMTDAPTEYEIITAMAFLHFFRQKCDIVVLEVGLGGRIDTTNVIDTPEVAIITAIGLDHMAQLGGTVEKIAGEKAGIIKKNGAVVCHPQIASVESVLREKCAEMNATVTFVNEAKIYHRGNIHRRNVIEGTHSLEAGTAFPGGQSFCYREREFFIPLFGAHQLRNAAVAIEATEILRTRGWDISDDALCKGLRKTFWPGRFEILRREPLFIVDVAHNSQGISAALCTLREIFTQSQNPIGSVSRPVGKSIFIFGVLADKDFAEMARLLSPHAKKFVLVTPESPRTLPDAELKKHVTGEAVVCESIASGVARALEIATPDDVIVALGSLSMIGQIRTQISNANSNGSRT